MNMNLSNNVQKFAFTLAEVLITLGIIGVVSAMTIPSLIQSYKEKQTVVTLKKFYSTMSQAFNLAKSQGVEPEDWATEKLLMAMAQMNL